MMHSVFIIGTGSLLLFCGFVTYRARLKYPRFSRLSVKNELKALNELIALSDWEEAERRVRELIQRGKGGKDALLLLIQVLRGTLRLEEALLLIHACVRDYPEELLFRLEEAQILLALGRPQEAMEAFRVSSPILRSQSHYYACALAHFQVGLVDAAWELLEGWLPECRNIKMLSLAADCLMEKKNYHKAIDLYQKVIHLGNASRQVLTRLGFAYKKLGDLTSSERLFRTILRKDPSDLAATLGVGACLQERGLHQQALAFYQSGEAWVKQDPRLFYQAGLSALITKKYTLAENYFTHIIHHCDPSSELLFYLGYSLECQHKWQEAEQVYLRLVRQFPAELIGYRALAWLYGVGLSTTLSSEQGLDFAYIALKIAPEPLSWEIVSSCEARSGNYQKAHQIQEFLISLNPDKSSRLRHQMAMRTLRKNHPLDTQQVLRSQVA